MSCGAYKYIREQLQRYPDSKFGFIVYRCTYESDDDWSRFMVYLDTSVRISLEAEELGDIADRLSWNVQEDAGTLDGANVEKVRKLVATVRSKFQAWIASGAEANHATSRHHACIMVNKKCLDAVLQGAPPPEKFDIHGDGWVYLISAKDGDKGDEFEPFTQIGISYIIPEAYSLLQGPGWPSVAVDPGFVSTL